MIQNKQIISQVQINQQKHYKHIRYKLNEQQYFEIETEMESDAPHIVEP